MKHAIEIYNQKEKMFFFGKFQPEKILSHMKFVLVTESSTMNNPTPKLIWAMMVFLCVGHTKTKE